MADIDPAPSWAPIRQLETTDRNLAGPGGVLNTQPTSIAARLNLLRDNATALNNTVTGVSSRQDAADSAIASLQSQVLDAPGTLSDLDHGAPITVTGDQFPDILSIDNSRGPVLALNESIADLARRDEWLKAQIEGFEDTGGSDSIGFLRNNPGAEGRSVQNKLSERVSVLDFGANPNGEDATKTTEAFTAAAAAIASGGVLYIPIGVYALENSVFLAWNTSLVLDAGTKIIPKNTGAFTASAIFLVNTLDGVTPAPNPFPNVTGFCENLWVDNSATPELVVGAAIVGAPMEFRNVRTNSTHFTVKSTNSYLDHFRIRGAYITQPRGTQYQIQLTGLGDGLLLESIHSYSDVGTPNAAQLNNCRGGAIIGSIGGNYRFSRCSALTMQGFHLETGQIISRGSDLAMRDGFFYCGNAPRVVFEDTAERRTCVMKNVLFNFNLDLVPSGYTPYDVEICDNLALSVSDCYKVTTIANDAGKSEQCGIMVRHVTDGPVPLWNRFSYFTSKSGVIKRAKTVQLNYEQFCGSGAMFTNTFSALTSLAKWTAESGTYYYNAVLYWDAVRRVGVTNSEAERSHVLTLDGNGVILPLNGLTNLSSQGVFRLYRGTTAGAYTHYVDVPIINCANLYDSGDNVNGYLWQTRTTGGKDPVETVGFFKVDGTQAQMRRSAAPGSGTFVVGDKVEITPPVAGGKIGSVCVTAGSPGTWKSWGTIDT
ncbi:hypothetical protein BRC2024_HCTLARHO_CDS_0094 [Acinetobacter phage vB_AbaS_Silvergun]